MKFEKDLTVRPNSGMVEFGQNLGLETAIKTAV